jgi:hypothetical protein
MNEINMMRNHIEELKNLEPLNSITEKKLNQKHIRMISVYVGLSIILISTGYFFYQGGKTLNLAQKKPAKTEASPVDRYPVPPDDTGIQPNVVFQPSKTPDPHLPIRGDSFIEKSKELVNNERIIDKAETVILSKPAPNIGEDSVFSSEQPYPKILKEKALLKKSVSVSVKEEVRLTESIEAGETSQAAPSEDKTKSENLPGPSDILLKSKKLIDKKLSSSGETGIIENKDITIKRDPLDSNGTQLNPLSVTSDEKKQADYKLSSASQGKRTKLNTDQNNPKDQSYMVSLHYTSDKNRELMEDLAVLLKMEGFDILGIEKVEYQNRDIRYFHDEDKPSALLLKKISNRIFTRRMNIEDINIKIKNLSKKYTKARKRALELWVNF